MEANNNQLAVKWSSKFGGWRWQIGKQASRQQSIYLLACLSAYLWFCPQASRGQFDRAYWNTHTHTWTQC